jgi:outer membrane receptor for ferrienterochelin and colicin
VWQKHRVTLGVEYRDDFRREFNNADQDPVFSYLKTNEGSRNWALFLQDEFAILENLILNGVYATITTTPSEGREPTRRVDLHLA